MSQMVKRVQGRWCLIFFVFSLLLGSLFPAGVEQAVASTTAKQITGLKLSQERIIIRGIGEEDLTQIQAFAVYADSTTEDITNRASWEVPDDQNVAVLYGYGEITPIGEGKTTITASYLNFSATAQIEVNLKASSKDVEWEQHYTDTVIGLGTYVEPTKDGGYILAGREYGDSGDNYRDPYIAKTNKQGVIEWSKTIEQKENFNSGLECIRQTKDGGYIAVGSVDWSIYVVKLTSKGKVQWEKIFTKYEINAGYSIQQTIDGGYIIAGATGEIENKNWKDPIYSAYLLKIKSTGKKEWEKTFSPTSDTSANIVIQTKDKGYILIGQVKGEEYSRSPYIVKVNSKGAKVWEKIINEELYGGYFYGQLTNDGGYVLYSENEILKLDSKGNVTWIKKVYDLTGDYDSLESLLQTKDGDFVLVTGIYVDSKVKLRILKLDSSGQKKWMKDIENALYDYTPYIIKETKDKGYIVVGQVSKEYDMDYLHPFLMKFTDLE